MERRELAGGREPFRLGGLVTQPANVPGGGLLTAATYLPIAHAGHWYWTALFVAPAILVLAGAIRTAVAERRKARDEGDGE